MTDSPSVLEGAPTPEEIVGTRPQDFSDRALKVAAYQMREVPVYARYCEAVGFEPSRAEAASGHHDTVEHGAHPDSSGRPPYLPVAAFRFSPVCAGSPGKAQRTFESSGTSGGAPARHHVRDLAYYHASLEAGFIRTFGSGPFRILAHLPRYAASSSLVYMLERLILRFGAAGSGFFLEDHALLLKAATERGERLLLFGAAFGLLDLLERAPIPLPSDALVIETGGMKTYRRAVPRDVLHERLLQGYGLERRQLWSEYGMCEMLSQCYAPSGGLFVTPPWVEARVVDPERPDREMPDGEAGALAITDLANVHSCSFLLTQDRAVRRRDGFEVLGRLSGAELRGCNHLLERA